MNFINRTKPNRIKAEKVPGTEDEYIITRVSTAADEGVEGTELNAEVFNRFENNISLCSNSINDLYGRVSKNDNGIADLSNNKLNLNNMVYRGMNKCLSELDDGIFFITKLWGGHEIIIAGDGCHAWTVVKNNIAFWLYPTDGRIFYHYDETLYATMISGEMFIYRIQ